MKRSIALLLLLLLLLTACSSPSTEKSKYEIVVVPQAWSQEVEDVIEAHVEELPELNVYQNTSEEPDAKYQALLVEDLMAQEVDAICVDPVDETVAAPVIEQAREAGIVVIIGTDIPAMIDQAAEALAKK